jgi:hypothetical protein
MKKKKKKKKKREEGRDDEIFLAFLIVEGGEIKGFQFCRDLFALFKKESLVARQEAEEEEEEEEEEDIGSIHQERISQ